MSFWTAPALLLGVLFSIGYASLLHLWGGRSVRDLFIYCISALVGFGLGQLIGIYTRIPFLEVGELHLIEGTVTAWVALVAIYLLGQQQISESGR